MYTATNVFVHVKDNDDEDLNEQTCVWMNNTKQKLLLLWTDKTTFNLMLHQYGSAIEVLLAVCQLMNHVTSQRVRRAPERPL